MTGRNIKEANMSIKTNAMIAHNGADGYTLHIDYDPDTDDFELKAVFNDGTVKELDGNIDDESISDQLITRMITSVNSDADIIGGAAFRSCLYLVSVNMPNVTIAKNSAFYSCVALKTVILPSLVTAESYTFYNNPILEYVYLGSSAETLASDMFVSVNAPVVIDCGFSADSPAAANAPWGATNATVNYDVAEPNPPVLSGLSLSPNPGLTQNIDLEPLEEIQPVEPEPVVEVKKTKRSSK